MGQNEAPQTGKLSWSMLYVASGSEQLVGRATHGAS